MFVTVTGENLTDDLKAELEEASRFFASLLLNKRSIETIGLEIAIEKDMPCFAECVHLGDREFEISLRLEEGDPSPIRCLAHEMVHLKQYVKKELSMKKIGKDTVEVWNGSVYKFKRHEHRYYDAPWEIEAFGREIGLMARWEDRLRDKQGEIKNG